MIIISVTTEILYVVIGISNHIKQLQRLPTTFATLQQGLTGAAVRDLQQDLNILKYYTGTIDGVFGANVTHRITPQLILTTS